MNQETIEPISTGPDKGRPFIVNSPSIQSPDAGVFTNFGPLNDRRKPTSQSRAMIIAASAIITVMGLFHAFFSDAPQDSLLLLGLSLVIWWLIAWKIRSLPINRKTRLLDNQLQLARENADKENAAKTRFLAIASHEMRTPLNGILGMSKLLTDTKLTPEQSSYNQAMQSSGEALFDLVENMLDFTSMDLGQIKLHPSPISLLQKIEEITELLAPKAHEKGLDISSFVDPALPEIIDIDGARLRQIIINLAGNAIKFTRSGGVSIEAWLKSSDSKNFTLQINVRDSGKGVNDTQKDSIFQEFKQENPDSIQNGVGLGLTITRSIVTKMRGNIFVKDRIGGGSEFIVNIPIGPVNIKDDCQPDVELPFQLESKNILIATDRIFTGNHLHRTLTTWGAQVTIQRDLVASSNLNKFDLIICDHNKVEAVNNLEKTEYILIFSPGNRCQLNNPATMGSSRYLITPIRHATFYEVLGSRISKIENLAEDNTPKNFSKSLKILLAEDNAVNALLVRAVLTKNNHRVETAETGKEAVQRLIDANCQNRPFDLVYMDLHMPELDGAEAIKEIRTFETKRELPKTPIIILSADKYAACTQELQNIGADDFLTKPIDPDDLLVNVAQQMEGQMPR